MAASKTKVPKLVDRIETKVKRLYIYFRGPATKWDYQKCCTTKPEVRNPIWWHSNHQQEVPTRYIGIFYLKNAIWDFTLLVTSHSIASSHIGFLDPENIGIAIGILLLSCLQVEKYVFPDWRPPSWIFDFRLRRIVFPIVPLEALSPNT